MLLTSYKNYKNHSQRAKILAWLMDLIFKPIYALLKFLSLKGKHKGKVDKILLVRLDHIGDLLMATPAISALRKKFPKALIDLLGGKRAQDVFRGNKDINRVLTFDATWYDPRRGNELWPVDIISTILKLRREKYHIAVDLRGDFRVIFLFLWLTGIPIRIGFHNLGLGFLLTDSVNYDPNKSYRDLNFDALSPLNIEQDDGNAKFFVTEEDEDYIGVLLKQNDIKSGDRIIGISPTTNRIEQRWDEKRFAEVADRLIEEFHVKVLLLSAIPDAALARLMTQHMKHRVIDLAGKTTLSQLAALMKKLALYIANDSGPMHLAIALNTPTIGLFGTTSIRKSWPYQQHSSFFRAITSEVDCERPCYEKDCDPKRCFDLISVDEVYKAASDILKLGSPIPS